jgi:hypothetical protein
MGVTGQSGPVATVEVDVLVAVDVEDLGSGSVADPHGLGRGDLPARRDPSGQRPTGPLAELARTGLALHEGEFLTGDHLVQCRRGLPRSGHLDGHDGLLVLRVMAID